MAAPILDREPETFSAGDSVSWLKSFADYPATDGWSLLYCFRGFKLSRLDVASVAGSDVPTTAAQGHLVSISAADSAALLAGQYSVVGYAVNADQRVKIFEGRIEVTPDFTKLKEGEDTRSWAKRNLDACQDAMDNRSGRVLVTSQNGDTRFEYISEADLQARWDFFAVKVRNEEIRELQKQGKPTGRTVYSQFSRPLSADSRNFPQ